MVKSPPFWDLAGLIEIGILGRARDERDLIERTEGPVTVKASTSYAHPFFSQLYRRTAVQYRARAKKGERTLFSAYITYNQTVHNFLALSALNDSAPLHDELNERVNAGARLVNAYKREFKPIYA